MNAYFTLAFITLLSLSAASQTKFEIGAEAGIINCKYKLNDPENHLRVPALTGGIAGINFRINTRKHLFYEAAILFTEYIDGITFKETASYDHSSSDEVLLLPIRVGYNFNPSCKINFHPLIGIVPSIRLSNYEGSVSSTQVPSQNLEYTYTRAAGGKDFLLLLLGGAGLDYRLSKRFKIGFNGSYYFGFANQAMYDITYRKQNRLYSATMDGKGNFISYTLGVRYLLGTF